MNVPAGHIGEEHVNLARQLLTRFRAVGRVEDLRNLQLRRTFFRRLGWKPDLILPPNEPINKLQADVWHFTSAETDWLRHVNRHDIALYQSINTSMR